MFVKVDCLFKCSRGIRRYKAPPDDVRLLKKGDIRQYNKVY